MAKPLRASGGCPRCAIPTAAIPRGESPRVDANTVGFADSYGLRSREIAALTLDDIDWKHERLAVPSRKAGHSTSFPLSRSVGAALVDHLRNGRPETSSRRVFFRAVAPVAPIGHAAIASRARHYLLVAGIQVARPGSHTLRHSCVQRLVDADFSLKTIGDFVGHRSPMPGDADDLRVADRDPAHMIDRHRPLVSIFCARTDYVDDRLTRPWSRRSAGSSSRDRAHNAGVSGEGASSTYLRSGGCPSCWSRISLGRYGLTITTCVPADPQSKGGSEATVRIAKADLVPTDYNLRPAYQSFGELEAACDTVNRDLRQGRGRVVA